MRNARRYNLHLGPAFLRTVRGFTHDERRSVARVLGLIQRNPTIDGVAKIQFAPEASLTTYVSPDFYVFYYVDQSTVFLVDLERI